MRPTHRPYVVTGGEAALCSGLACFAPECAYYGPASMFVGAADAAVRCPSCACRFPSLAQRAMSLASRAGRHTGCAYYVLPIVMGILRYGRPYCAFRRFIPLPTMLATCFLSSVFLSSVSIRGYPWSSVVHGWVTAARARSEVHNDDRGSQALAVSAWRCTPAPSKRVIPPGFEVAIAPNGLEVAT